LSTESVTPKEPVTAPTVAASVPASAEAQPLTVNVPSGNLSNITASGLVNFYYPYLPQAANATISGVKNATFSGNVIVYNVSSTGWSSVNNQGFVFQNDQYNSRREGGGQ